jgi:Phosphotransferase enzyme family
VFARIHYSYLDLLEISESCRSIFSFYCLQMESSPRTVAALLNEIVMDKLTAALEDDPEVNLLSLIPPSYKDQISQVLPPESEIAELNRLTINRMEKRFRKEPENDLISTFQNFYRKKYDAYKHTLDPSTAEKISERSKRGAQNVAVQNTTTLQKLEDKTEATAMSPLSNTVIALLDHITGSVPPYSKPEQSLAEKLKRTFQNSAKLFEFPLRGTVFKCGDDIVAKVVRMGALDTTEYTAIQYLARHAPDFPAPKPHGLVTLGKYTVIFMSYIPSMTLEEAWPSMTHDQKASVQSQLDDIFQKLRQLKQPDGSPLGGMGTEGVKDLHREDYRSDQVIVTAADFENWKFSLSHFATDQYIKFLRSFLPPPAAESVFSHGDLRPANIMVDVNESGDYSVTGIIDWEDGGFYPEYHECTKATNTLNSGEKSDWFQYLPPCIAPRTFPVWWLVDRLWDRNILYAN